MNHFGELLREARLRARLTQREVARKVDVHDTYVSKMETGVESPPSRKVVLKLAEVLGLTKKADRFRFLLAAGVASEDDARGFALVEVAREDTSHAMRPPIEQAMQKASSLTTLLHAPLHTSPHEILLYRLKILKTQLAEAEKTLHNAHEQLSELDALVARIQGD